MKITNLKAYLANIGMSLKDFCEIIDCSDKHMSKVMNGRRKAGPRLAKDVHEITDGIVELEVAPRNIRKKKQKNKQDEEGT